MNALVVLIGASLFVAVCFLLAFIWSVRSGQYEDKVTPAIRILFNDKDKPEDEKINNGGNKK